MIDFSKFNNLISLTSYFNNENICKQTIIESRWEDGDVVCPYCGAHHCSLRPDGRFRCNHCKKNFSCLVGTIFENTKVSLIKWFVAMYLISSHKKGISSAQLARDINVTQSAAWYMLQKVRRLYPQDDSQFFQGTVECDEVYIGGKEKWKHKSMRTPNTQGRSTKTKTPVFGMIERSSWINEKGEEETMSYVHAFVVNKTDKATLQTIINQFVVEGSSVVTDELNAYHGLCDLGYRHSVVNHGGEQYADGDIFTNSIEGFWSHLQQYIDEAVYRWNTRKASESERFSDMFVKSIGLVLKWDELKLCVPNLTLGTIYFHLSFISKKNSFYLKKAVRKEQ